MGGEEFIATKFDTMVLRGMKRDSQKVFRGERMHRRLGKDSRVRIRSEFEPTQQLRKGFGVSFNQFFRAVYHIVTNSYQVF